MGTNYYLESPELPPCRECGRSYEKKLQHIGKSSAGWVFTLHVYPDAGIKDLPDWYDLWTKPGMLIRDEYNRLLTPVEMLAEVLARFGKRNTPKEDSSWFKANDAEPGPYNLARARIDGKRVIGHGLGTYALHTGYEDSW